MLDARGPWEFDICGLDGPQLLPMGQLQLQLLRLDPERETLVICHHGIRSRQVAGFLERQGFADGINLTGGLYAWAREVDLGMATY